MSKTGVVFLFLFEQYASLLFVHTGFPSNLVTQVYNINKKSSQKISADLQSYVFSMTMFSKMTDLIIVFLKNSTLQTNKIHGFQITRAVSQLLTCPYLPAI
jgi:hypothetical protein